jgi:hypothetical protein
MGLAVMLENEEGEPISVTEDGEPIEAIYDEHNLLHRILPSYTDYSYQFLRFIDWYGDTVFNRMQMEVFLSEWKRLYSKVKTKEEMILLKKIEKLAEICQEEIHLYLKFYGD